MIYSDTFGCAAKCPVGAPAGERRRTAIRIAGKAAMFMRRLSVRPRKSEERRCQFSLFQCADICQLPLDTLGNTIVSKN